MDEIKIIKENLDSIGRKFQGQNAKLTRAQEQEDRYKNIVLTFLKSKIGQNIYWASKNWSKYETHTIVGISVDIETEDFFGKEYVGKECIRIYLEGGGYYIADKIGDTLFFNEGEAQLRTRKN